MEKQEEKNVVQELTYGQKMVGIKFNPSELGTVDRVKQHYANIIDMMHGKMTDKEATDHQQYFYGEAISQAVTAQMWAVKALTWKD